MSQEFTNNASARLISDLQPADTSITLAPGDGDRFPQPDQGDDDSFSLITVEDVNANFEIMKMTHRSGDILYVDRAQEGTAPAGFGTGSRCECRLTAGTLGNFKQKFDQYDLRGDVIDSDGLRLWHETDPASYQYFHLRFYTLGIFGAPVMTIEPPEGISGLGVMAQITTADGAKRGILLNEDQAGSAPSTGEGKAQFSVPGQIRMERINDYWLGPQCYMQFDKFVAGTETENRLNMKSTTGAMRFTWSPRDVSGREEWAGFVENAALSVNAGIEVRNPKTPTYPNAQGVEQWMGVSVFTPGTDDWCAWLSNAATAESVQRGLFYSWYTETMEDQVATRKVVSIAHGQVYVGEDPEEDNQLARKAYVDAAVTGAVGGTDYDVIAARFYGRTVMWNSDQGTDDGSIKTYLDGAKLDDFYTIEITAKGNSTDFFTMRVDSQTLIDKGYGSTRWPVPQASGTGGDIRSCYFQPKSLTTFSASQEKSGGKIVRVVGLHPKVTAASGTSSNSGLPAPAAGRRVIDVDNIRLNRVVKTADY